MLATVALSTLLLASSAAAEERTLWLVQPLYPGQEVLIGRTEEAIDKLWPKESRSREVIGRKELAETLTGKPADLACLFGEKACTDPVDAFVGGLGFDRVVLVRGGQDESGYHYKVVSYRPSTGEASPAEASNPGLERALLGALVKVVPLASSLVVASNPPGATVYIDEVKVGVTPLSTQVLPGERVIRLDLKSHQPWQESLVVSVRGDATFERTLEKVAARVTITASPPGTDIAIDGQVIGKDKIDRGIGPGSHTLRLSREGHTAFETMFQLKADESYTLDKTLEAIPLLAATAGGSATVAGAPGPSGDPGVAAPPPPAPAIGEQIYERRSYFEVAAEPASLKGGKLYALRLEDESRISYALTPDRSLIGISAEYGTFGRHFGLSVIAVSYAQGFGPWSFSVSHPKNNLADGSVYDPIEAKLQLVSLRALQPQFRWVFWRVQVSAQAGLELRLGLIHEAGSSPAYPRGFQPVDLMLNVRGSVRGYLVAGMYLHVAYGTQFSLLSSNAGSKGFTAGLGYAF